MLEQKICIGREGIEALVSPIGGTVTEFRVEGRDIIYPERAVREKSRGGIPICFPFFGSPPEKFSAIPKHGWLRKQSLVKAMSDDTQVIFRGINDRNGTYPWGLLYEIRVSINVGELSVAMTVCRMKDNMDTPAPINPAFHPYFSNLGSHSVLIGEGLITEFFKEATMFGVQSQREFLINLGEVTVKMTLRQGFDFTSCLTLWSDDDEKYFCVEPVATFPQVFDAPCGIFLKRWEEFQMMMTLKVL